MSNIDWSSFLSGGERYSSGRANTWSSTTTWSQMTSSTCSLSTSPTVTSSLRFNPYGLAMGVDASRRIQVNSGRCVHFRAYECRHHIWYSDDRVNPCTNCRYNANNKAGAFDNYEEQEADCLGNINAVSTDDILRDAMGEIDWWSGS